MERTRCSTAPPLTTRGKRQEASCLSRGGIEGRVGRLAITIRRVRSSDASALQRHCFPDQALWEVQGYLIWCERQAAKGQMVRLVAEVSGEAMANAQLTLRRDWAEIGSLVVAEGWRRQGIATRLIEALTEIARQQGVRALEIGVSQSAPGVQRLYRSLGFVPYKEVELDFIREGNRVVYLRKELGEG